MPYKVHRSDDSPGVQVEMNAVKGIRAIPWSIVVALLPIMITTGVLRAQEVEPAQGEISEDEGLQLALLAGLRLELAGIPSPGANMDMVLGFSGPVWVSGQLLTQMIRGKFGVSGRARDQLRMGRIRLGLGKRQWSIYALYEKGTGVIKSDPRAGSDDYNLEGVGLGVGRMIGRFAVSLEAIVGGSSRGDHGPYGSLGVSVQYRLVRAIL